MMGIVAGVAGMFGATVDRLKLRVDALEKTPPAAVAVKRCSCGKLGAADP